MNRRGPRLLLVVPELDPDSETGICAAHAIHALREDYRLSLLTYAEPDWSGINESLGVDVKDEDLTLILGSRLALPGKRLPWLNRLRLNARARQLLGGFELVISLDGEADFGVNGMQYIHRIRGHWEPETKRWHWCLDRSGLMARIYLWLGRHLGRFEHQGMAMNITLASSRWLAERVQADYGIPAAVVTPPTPGVFEDRDWEDRGARVLCRPPRGMQGVALDIVHGARERGADLALDLVLADKQALPSGVDSTASWLNVIRSPDQAQWMALLNNAQIGLDVSVRRGYSIPAAQMVLAGCLPLVPVNGGAAEIVDVDQRLVWRDAGEAAEKLYQLLASPGSCALVREHMLNCRERLLPSTYATMMRGVVALVFKPQRKKKPAD